LAAVLTKANQECGFIPDDTEEIDVGVVDGEVDEDGSSTTVDPQVVLKQTNKQTNKIY